MMHEHVYIPVLFIDRLVYIFLHRPDEGELSVVSAYRTTPFIILKD